MHRDSIANTFIVATAVCLVCSFLVASAAVGLKSWQDRNVELDRKKNILKSAGIDDEAIKRGGGVDALFNERFEAIIIELATGEPASQVIADLYGYGSPAEANLKYDQIKAAASQKPDRSLRFASKKENIAGIGKYHEKFSHVYLLKSESGNEIEAYVFPVRGYGLWSTLKGFLAVKNDFQTIAGLTFYEHGETPGLGGEVDNVNWKAQWIGKQIYDADGGVAIQVVKGVATDEFGVDGLSGATITSNGVSNLLAYWMGPQGFGPYIEKEKGKQNM